MFALGFVLVMVSLLLILAEAHLTTGGLIASGAAVALIGGVVALLVGAGAGLVLVLPVAAGVCAASAAGVAVVGRGMRSVQRLPPRSGIDAMVGRIGVVRARDRGPTVFVDGGLWRAQASVLEDGRPLHDGERVVVEHVSGLTLCVRKAESWELQS